MKTQNLNSFFIENLYNKGSKYKKDISIFKKFVY